MKQHKYIPNVKCRRVPFTSKERARQQWRDQVRRDIGDDIIGLLQSHRQDIEFQQYEVAVFGADNSFFQGKTDWPPLAEGI